METYLGLNASAWQYILWMSACSLGIVVARYSAVPIYLGKWGPDSWLNRIFNLHIDPKTGQAWIQIQSTTYYGANRWYHYRNMLVAFSLFFYFGRVEQKYFQDPISDLKYLMIAYLTASLYGIIFEIRGMNYSITPSEFHSMSCQFKIWLGVVFSASLALLVYHLQLASEHDYLTPYCLVLFGFPALMYGAYWDIVSQQPRASWHIHHWFIGLCGACLWCFDDPISKTANAIYFGIFLLGASDGLSPVLYNKFDPDLYDHISDDDGQDLECLDY